MSFCLFASYLYIKPPLQVGIVRQIHWQFLLDAVNERSVVNVLLQQFLLQFFRQSDGLQWVLKINFTQLHITQTFTLHSSVKDTNVLSPRVYICTGIKTVPCTRLHQIGIFGSQNSLHIFHCRCFINSCEKHHSMYHNSVLKCYSTRPKSTGPSRIFPVTDFYVSSVVQLI